MLILTLTVQVYIVSGGYPGYGDSLLSSTETLEKDGGSEWQEVASLPSARQGLQGVGLDNGRFIVTGNYWAVLYHHNLNSCRWLDRLLFSY